LRDGAQLTRAELGAALRRAGVNTDGTQRLARLMFRAELDALVCSGARRGKQFTYALLDERVPPAPSLDRDEALLELTRRYFATRGPATPHDFAWWSGLTVADAVKGIQMCGAALCREVIGDRSYWFDPSTSSGARKSSRAFLLPNYDEYFIGFKDRSAIGERLRSVDLVTGGDALTAHVIVIDGQLVGGWRRTITTDALALHLKLLTALSPGESRAVAAAARAYGDFLGLPVEVREPAVSRPRRGDGRRWGATPRPPSSDQ
jgi:hypothetical protein